jgi:hypothetical protein
MSVPAGQRSHTTKYQEQNAVTVANDNQRQCVPPPAVRRPGDRPSYVTEPSDNDILLGRGKACINYIGNQRYRALVRTRKEEYVNCVRTYSKELIAREILAEISQRGGRFLQQVVAAPTPA